MIINKEYGETRKGQFTKYSNIDEVEGDAVRVMYLFKEVLKIPVENITFLKDATYEEIDGCFDGLKK